MSEKYIRYLVVGRDDSQIDYDSLEKPVHRDIVKPFLALREKAREQNFDLAIASGFRNFDRQLLIWNDKALGVRPVLDDAGEPLDIARLEPWELVQAILRWSALPGGSRHHWGSDIDVYDRAAVAADYQVQLSAQEVADGGPFGAMHCWLDQQIEQLSAEGFFRPYDRDRGGVAPERWHLSFAPLARQFEELLTVDTLRRVLASQPLLLKEAVLSHLDEIFARYIRVWKQGGPS